ncbi:MAG: NUDIX domain-containing protein [Candidatus Altimarinota bacterium]
MNKKRYAAIIETDHGVLLVQEKKDKEVPHRLNSVLNSLRKLDIVPETFGDNSQLLQTMNLSLISLLEGYLSSPPLNPEPNLIRKNQIFQQIWRFVQLLEKLPEQLKLELKLGDLIRDVNIISIIIHGRYSLPGGGMEERDEGQPARTIIREIEEELRLRVARVDHAFTLTGEKRTHEMYRVKVFGRLEPNLNEISGIGFLNNVNTFPINTTFFMGHVVWLYTNYIMSNKAGLNREDVLKTHRAPNMTVLDEDIRRLFVQRAYVASLRAKTKEFEVSLPTSTDRLLIEYNQHAKAAGKPVYNDDYTIAEFCSETHIQEPTYSPALSPQEMANAVFSPAPKTSDSQELYIGEAIPGPDQIVATSSTKVAELLTPFMISEDAEFSSPDSDIQYNPQEEAKKPFNAKKSGSHALPTSTQGRQSLRRRGTFAKPLIKTSQFRPQKKKA